MWGDEMLLEMQVKVIINLCEPTNVPHLTQRSNNCSTWKRFKCNFCVIGNVNNISWISLFSKKRKRKAGHDHNAKKLKSFLLRHTADEPIHSEKNISFVMFRFRQTSFLCEFQTNVLDTAHIKSYNAVLDSMRKLSSIFRVRRGAQKKKRRKNTKNHFWKTSSSKPHCWLHISRHLTYFFLLRLLGL